MVAANLTLPAAIRALLLTGVYNITVQDVAVPQLPSPTDAIMRLTPSAICGSDLFAYSGFAPEQPSHVPGHEGIGYVARVGSAVAALSAGDYVVILDNLHHGQLLFPNPRCWPCLLRYVRSSWYVHISAYTPRHIRRKGT